MKKIVVFLWSLLVSGLLVAQSVDLQIIKVIWQGSPSGYCVSLVVKNNGSDTLIHPGGWFLKRLDYKNNQSYSENSQKASFVLAPQDSLIISGGISGKICGGLYDSIVFILDYVNQVAETNESNNVFRAVCSNTLTSLGSDVALISAQWLDGLGMFVAFKNNGPTALFLDEVKYLNFILFNPDSIYNAYLYHQALFNKVLMADDTVYLLLQYPQLQIGDYPNLKIIITSPCDCDNNSYNDTLRYSHHVGFPEKEINFFKVYPNPFMHDLIILASFNSSIKIYDLTGKEMLSSNVQAGQNKLVTSSWPPGFYIIKMTDQTKVVLKGP